MNFTSIMHVSFFTDQLDAMRDFYVNKLGCTTKIVTKAKAYLDKPNSHYHEIALKDPEAVIIVYLEIAPNQFIELFPKNPGQEPHDSWNKKLGYSHFALTVDDIYETRKELEERGVVFDTDISKGPSETYQMWTHDPDGNMFEIMQFTEKSTQLVGNIME